MFLQFVRYRKNYLSLLKHVLKRPPIRHHCLPYIPSSVTYIFLSPRLYLPFECFIWNLHLLRLFSNLVRGMFKLFLPFWGTLRFFRRLVIFSLRLFKLIMSMLLLPFFNVQLVKPSFLSLYCWEESLVNGLLRFVRPELMLQVRPLKLCEDLMYYLGFLPLFRLICRKLYPELKPSGKLGKMVMLSFPLLLWCFCLLGVRLFYCLLNSSYFGPLLFRMDLFTLLKVFTMLLMDGL